MSLKKVVATLTVVTSMVLGGLFGSPPAADAVDNCALCVEIVVDCESLAAASSGCAQSTKPTLELNDVPQKGDEEPSADKHNWKRMQQGR